MKDKQQSLPTVQENTPRLPKLNGADIELGNFILGLNRPGGTGYEASRALLQEVAGLPRAPSSQWGTWSHSARPVQGGPQPVDSTATDAGGQVRYHHLTGRGVEADGGYGMGASHPPAGYGTNWQDRGRKFLPSNGGCVYIDLNHLELCLPEVISAYDHVACWHAMLRIARRALEAANRKQPPGQEIQVLVNNSDGQGNSYGSHLNFLITRRAWNNLFDRKLHHLLYLAAYQASSLVFTGQGKAGSENGAPPAAFQLSQRADFFETLIGAQTTHHRPIVNSRDEPLCGRESHGGWDGRTTAEEMARLHVIFLDNTLCQVATLLKVGVMQIILAMIEAEDINPELILDDPVDAVMRWSHDPTLQRRVRTASGKERTAVELQLLFLEEAKRFAQRGGCHRIVPRAGEILNLWEDTLMKLKAGDLASLAPRLDWVLKLSLLHRSAQELGWEAPQIKHLDHVYSSLDPVEGLYWAYERADFVERVVSQAQIEQFVHQPPEETRAWTRAMLLRARPDLIESVDWDSIRFRSGSKSFWPTYRTLALASPIALTKAETETIFESDLTPEERLTALERLQTVNGTGHGQPWPDHLRSQTSFPSSAATTFQQKKGGPQHEDS